MIVTDNNAPRWIQELARFIHVKSLLVLHGNVLDLVSYPVDDVGSGEPQWTHGDTLSAFLARYLTESNYEIVGTVDPVDGLRFEQEEMRTRYEDVLREAPARGGRQDNRGSGNAALTALVDVPRVLANARVPSAFVVNFASRLVAEPEHLSDNELDLFTRLLRGSLDSSKVIRDGQRWNNVLILICDKPNDLPPFLYVNNPRTRSINVDKPGRAERNLFFHAAYPSFHGVAPQSTPPAELATLFSVLTDGLTYYELSNLVSLSRKEGIGVQPPEPLIERYKYGITTSEWDSAELKQRLRSAPETMRARVKGQDAAVARTLDIIKRARLGLAAGAQGQSQRPRGVLFFAGPTGVGKTELAKTLATVLFGNEDRLIRFDMSEYSKDQADQRLLGAPPGYVGYNEGGQLTRQVKEHPFSVLLFDEIEKAHPLIFDKFLQILDDGRLTDGQGETVYFSQSVIIFTSNLGTVITDEQTGARHTLMPEDMAYPELRESIHKSIEDHFKLQLGRPEILNRFGDNFVVFDFIRSPLDQDIVDMLVHGFVQTLSRERNIALTLTENARGVLMALAQERLDQGGRGMRNVIDSALINPLARWLSDNELERDAVLQLDKIVDHGSDAHHQFELEITSRTQ